MQWTKKLTVYLRSILIVFILLIPQRNYSQFSDSTIKQINQRLIRCIECEEKLNLYQQLSARDSVELNRQQQTIVTQNENISRYKRSNKILRTVNTVTFALLLLAVILWNQMYTSSETNLSQKKYYSSVMHIGTIQSVTVTYSEAISKKQKKSGRTYCLMAIPSV